MQRLLLTAVLLIVAIASHAQSIGGSPFVAVHGKARTEVVPDIFPLAITLEDTSQDAAGTQRLIENYAQEIIGITQSMKMPDADVDIANLSVSPEYRYNDNTDKQTFLGNRYRREIKLRFHSLADLKRVIEMLPKAKQVRLDTGTFQSSKGDELRRQLLTKAVEDANKTADVMAKAVGRRVGGVHNISNQGFNVRYVESDDTTLDRVQVTGSAAQPGPQIALREGTIQLDQNVYIIYTLVD